MEENKTMEMPKGEPTMEQLWDMVKQKMPMPDEAKDAVIKAFLYVLSM